MRHLSTKDSEVGQAFISLSTRTTLKQKHNLKKKKLSVRMKNLLCGLMREGVGNELRVLFIGTVFVKNVGRWKRHELPREVCLSAGQVHRGVFSVR